MTTARLSPAANLLRNSKLFALPPAVPLPPAKPTVDVVFRSDTATTVHPTTAAIHTDSPSLSQGDWGLKRPLPGKAFHRTTTPVIRLRSDVDTHEHIADFDSAADHVLTLQKWQNYPILLTSGSVMKGQAPRLSAFNLINDNTTAKPVTVVATQSVPAVQSGTWNNAERLQFLKSSHDDSSRETSANEKQPSLSETLEQYKRDFTAHAEETGRTIPQPAAPTPPVRVTPRRWRYEGPWIAGITNMDFEDFLQKVDGEKVGAFREHLKRGIVAQRQSEHAEAVRIAKEEDQDPPNAPALEVSSEQIDSQLRTLREDTKAFAGEIASFFDLPDSIDNTSRDYAWIRTATETAAQTLHQQNGPPRTHPSAGFSYLRSDRYASMSPKFGPQYPSYPIPARHLKKVNSKAKAADGSDTPHMWGVGGFVVNVGQTGSRAEQSSWRTTNGGPKAVASITRAFVASDGSIQLRANLGAGRLGDGNVPLNPGDVPIDSIPKGVSTIPQLDHDESRRVTEGRRTPGLYARSMPSGAGGSADPMDDLDSMFRRS